MRSPAQFFSTKEETFTTSLFLLRYAASYAATRLVDSSLSFEKLGGLA